MKNPITSLHKNKGCIKVIQFNVGAGDHTLIQFPDEEYAIIDFHYDFSADDAVCEAPAITYLQKLKKAGFEPKLKFVCISHLDHDHILKFDASLRRLADTLKIEIGQIWISKSIDIDDSLQRMFNNNAKLRKLFEDNVVDSQLQRLMQETYQRINFLFEEKRFRKMLVMIDSDTHNVDWENSSSSFLGPNVDIVTDAHVRREDFFGQLICNFADKERNVKQRKIKLPRFNVGRNELSIIFKIQHGSNCLLFTGDANMKIFNKLIANSIDLKAQFIKVAHHGSKKSSSPEIWRSLLPQRGVVFSGISAGAKNKHPHRTTITHMRRATTSKHTHYILNTNLATAELSKINLVQKQTDLFDTPPDTNQVYKGMPPGKVRFPQVSGDLGVMAFVYEIYANHAKAPQIWLSPGMRIYRSKFIRHCPHSPVTTTVRSRRQ